MSLPGGGDHSGIDAHIATLEEALDALKRERYSRECSPASGETDGTRRQRDEDKARALASENDLLLRVLRKVMLEKESPLITSHVLTKTTPKKKRSRMHERRTLVARPSFGII